MGKEIECKIKIADREILVVKLLRLGAGDAGDGLERNWVFDTLDNKLRQTGKLLRLREYKGCCLTFKGGTEEAKFKQRMEIETNCSSLENTREILLQLGYVETWYYEKYRHVLTLNGCEIALDKVPELGCFIEIEGSEEQIDLLLEDLGLQVDQHIKESYFSLFQIYSQQLGRDLGAMRFSVE